MILRFGEMCVKIFVIKRALFLSENFVTALLSSKIYDCCTTVLNFFFDINKIIYILWRKNKDAELVRKFSENLGIHDAINQKYIRKFFSNIILRGEVQKSIDTRLSGGAFRVSPRSQLQNSNSNECTKVGPKLLRLLLVRTNSAL